MKAEIIDFHTHPYRSLDFNICRYKTDVGTPYEKVREFLEDVGIKRICGSVVNVANKTVTCWEDMKRLNDEAIAMAKELDGFYVPGFHVHPEYPEESVAEMERMHSMGVNLIGELVPAVHGWSDYGSKEIDVILDKALELNMIFNFHTMNEDSIDRMVEKHPDNIIVAAHPGEQESFTRHLARMEKSENYYLDLSGTGIFRHGMLAYGIKCFGAERFLFGSDFPVCNPAVYVGGVCLDSLISNSDKEKILHENADRLLKATENKFYKN